MDVCVFNKHHIMKKSLLAHYLKCHINDYKRSKKNGWFCIKNTSKIFRNEEETEKHCKNCEFCQKKNDVNYIEEVSTFGHEVIEKKMPKDKFEINFPKFDFDKYKRKVDESKYIKNEDFLDYIDQEKNIFY